jgi:PKHD-type hydroxylase
MIMFLEVKDLLSGTQVSELLTIASTANFIDGRISNPNNPTKNNLQLHDQNAYTRSSKIMVEALFSRAEFVDFAFPKIIAPPMITKYAIGMKYGMHADAALIPIGQRPIRTDLSITIFLADPASYDGGELSVQLGTQTLFFKGAPGSAIVYPSNTLHQVIPVTRGERIAAISFIESEVPDINQRDLLYELNEIAALEGNTMAFENYSRLQRIQYGLRRMWSDPPA